MCNVLFYKCTASISWQIAFSVTFCKIVSVKFLLQDVVKERASPVYTKKKIPAVTQSYHELMVRRVLQDFATSIVQVSDTSLANEYVV